MPNKVKRINLALQGGGSHGAFAVGALDVLLQDERLKIDSISATSAGAINAIILTQGLINNGREGARKALFDFWNDVSEYGKLYAPVKMTPLEILFGIPAESSTSYQTFNWMTELLSPYQFNPLDFNPLRNLLEKHVNFEQIQKTKLIRLFISATNVKTGKIRVFEPEELCINTILASTCLPFLFQATKVGEEYYWDGGYMGNPSIFPLVYHSHSKDILILHINPIVRDKIPKTVEEINNRVNEISFNSSLVRELRAISFMAGLLESGHIQITKGEAHVDVKRIYLHSIRADCSLSKFSVASKLDTNPRFLEKLFALGRKRMSEWLKTNFKQIGKASTMDMDEFL